MDGWRRVTDAFMGSVCVAASVQLKFASLSEDDVLVDPQRKLPALSFWLNKNNYNSQQAQLWCLTRMWSCLLVLNTKMEILVFWVLLVVKVQLTNNVAASVLCMWRSLAMLFIRWNP